jgi:hypothetical protein
MIHCLGIVGAAVRKRELSTARPHPSRHSKQVADAAVEQSKYCLVYHGAAQGDHGLNMESRCQESRSFSCPFGTRPRAVIISSLMSST